MSTVKLLAPGEAKTAPPTTKGSWVATLDADGREQWHQLAADDNDITPADLDFDGEATKKWTAAQRKEFDAQQ